MKNLKIYPLTNHIPAYLAVYASAFIATCYDYCTEEEAANFEIAGYGLFRLRSDATARLRYYSCQAWHTLAFSLLPSAFSIELCNR
jgi:hypothetical protein